MSTFQQYGALYDLLYRDKDYEAEAEYIGRLTRAFVPSARTILGFCSGTGRHGRLLAAQGFDVRGIERSPDMVVRAQAADIGQHHGRGPYVYELDVE